MAATLAQKAFGTTTGGFDVAFGGPIFYGHAADGFNEGPTHPGNVFWPQAVAANKLFDDARAAFKDGRVKDLRNVIAR